MPSPRTDPSSVASAVLAGTEVAQVLPLKVKWCLAPECALVLRQAEGSMALEAVPWRARAYPAAPEGTACLRMQIARAGEHRHWVPQVLA